MKKYIVQEWNKHSGWYDLPDGPEFRSERKAASLLALQHRGNEGRNDYRYRLISRTEEILCDHNNRPVLVRLG